MPDMSPLNTPQAPACPSVRLWSVSDLSLVCLWSVSKLSQSSQSLPASLGSSQALPLWPETSNVPKLGSRLGEPGTPSSSLFSELKSALLEPKKHPGSETGGKALPSLDTLGPLGNGEGVLALVPSTPSPTSFPSLAIPLEGLAKAVITL